MVLRADDNELSFNLLSGNRFGKMGLAPIALAFAVGFCFLFLVIYQVFGVWFHEPMYSILEEYGNILGVTADVGETAAEVGKTGNKIVAGCWNFVSGDWDGDGEHGEFWKELV